MPKTDNVDTTVLAKAFKSAGIRYESEDITEETYEMLNKKREAALLHQKEFETEGISEWLDLLMLQTEFATKGYDVFSREMSRYIYTVRK